MNREKYVQDPPIRLVTLNAEKQKSSTRIEPVNTYNWNNTDLSTTKQIVIWEDKINTALVKKIMTEKKTTLPFIRNQDLKRVKVEIEMVNNFFRNIQNRQHHWAKRANLCGKETTLRENRCSLKEHEQKYKNLDGKLN